MSNTKEELNSADTLIGKLYTKINQRNKRIKKLKKELSSTKDELVSVKEAYYEMCDRMELLEDLHPMVLDTLRDHGFDVDGEDDDDA